MALTDEVIREQLEGIVPELKHCKLLGIRIRDAGIGRLILELPYSEAIIGNPETGVIHGGVLTTLMDTACGFASVAALTEPSLCPTLDLRIDYMKPAEPGRVVLGDAEAYRVTSTVVFARGVAYHEGEKNDPIAHCTASFMRLDPQLSKTKA